MRERWRVFSIVGRPEGTSAVAQRPMRQRNAWCCDCVKKVPYRSIREQTGLALSTIPPIIAEQEAAEDPESYSGSSSTNRSKTDQADLLRATANRLLLKARRQETFQDRGKRRRCGNARCCLGGVMRKTSSQPCSSSPYPQWQHLSTG